MSGDSARDADGCCEDCQILTEALQEIEQQRREAERQGPRAEFSSLARQANDYTRDEITYLAKLEKLRRRRDCALEVLFQHQKIEHPERT